MTIPFMLHWSGVQEIFRSKAEPQRRLSEDTDRRALVDKLNEAGYFTNFSDCTIHQYGAIYPGDI